MFEKPLGMRDTLPELYEMKHRTRSAISEEMKRWGYQFIETPALNIMIPLVLHPLFWISNYLNY